jgi:hypothetical protein
MELLLHVVEVHFHFILFPLAAILQEELFRDGAHRWYIKASAAASSPSSLQPIGTRVQIGFRPLR